MIIVSAMWKEYRYICGRAFDACREYAVKQGFDGMIFGLCNSRIEQDAYDECIVGGKYVTKK